MSKAKEILEKLKDKVFMTEKWLVSFAPIIGEAIAELEELMNPKTCNGCKHNYLIDNFDSVEGKKLDGFSPNECYMCSRNCNDMYEQKV